MDTDRALAAELEELQRLEEEIASGGEALARGAWANARAAFERALHRDGDARMYEGGAPQRYKGGSRAGAAYARAYEGLGTAAWWLDDAATATGARTRAFRLYQDAGDRRSAARVATALAMDRHAAGDDTDARGWLRWARGLLEGVRADAEAGAEAGTASRAGSAAESGTTSGAEPGTTSGTASGAEAGWLAVREAQLALAADHDPEAAVRAATAAVAVGRASADRDLELLGLAHQGLAMVGQGHVGEGMRLVDGAAAAAVAGEIRDPDAAATCCRCLVSACEQLQYYERAARSCRTLRDLAARSHHRLMLSICRTHEAGVLFWRGLWPEAEAELATAIRALEATRPARAAEPVVQLARLRCRQGRFEEAATLLDGISQAEQASQAGQADQTTQVGQATLRAAPAAGPPPRAPGGIPALLVRAELELERGDAGRKADGTRDGTADRKAYGADRNDQNAYGIADGSAAAAADLAERYLRELGPTARLERAPGLELLARAKAATGDVRAAEAAATELAAVAADAATEPMRASACLAAGAVAAALGDHEKAGRRFADAVDHYGRGGVFEAARARLRLADTLAALGRAPEAAAEAQAAYRAFHTLGAERAEADAAALLRGIAASVSDRTDRLGGAGTHLTPREVEILRLLARGLSDQQIAEELFLSLHTVVRHLDTIYDKLGAAGSAGSAARARAAAFALTHGVA
ncbi:helix-turn-helix transcriptional regulator [Streptomyces sp. XD-27]|uniref:helix-turn-helix domain-containing protein n=1 Tax=Streptomyces sp. XD-27 TaxID=3062779 RepID=UPI0026F473EF|nr:helix-turn-helix transcriptional regulator [Streptomyces sp. XD-27]WKX71384.1 helix-turn-helix transcriptional regulator [Streptomyces sp. XD-27]